MNLFQKKEKIFIMFKLAPASFEQLDVKSTIYQPLLFDLSDVSDMQDLERILSVEQGVVVYDQIKSQIRELITCQNPTQKLTETEYESLSRKLLNGFSYQEYGKWVLYPWSKRLVHILPEKEFVQLRTSRNHFKITPQEQAVLATKKVGIIGLSVGKSVALTMAMERSFGEIRLADFDELDLSNLNRICTSIHNLGTNKAILTAREIAEIDPYLSVKCFIKGITANNIDDFFEQDGTLDLLIEECDDFEIKLLAREKARSLKVPVVMDTSDRGLVDVERFDLEPDRAIFHGKLDNINRASLGNLSNEQKVLVALKMLGVDTLSPRMKASMLEINQQIKTWPQLATSVVLGGAIAGNVSRRIFLNQFNESGRYNVDINELICDQYNDLNADLNKSDLSDNWKEKLVERAKTYDLAKHKHRLYLEDHLVEELINAAILAPSGGNAQPWFWIQHKSILFLFYDPKSPKTFLDCNFTGTRLALGAASENLTIKANKLGLSVNVELLKPNQAPLTAVFSFNEISDVSERIMDNEILNEFISLRVTNRRLVKRVSLSKEKLNSLKSVPSNEYSLQFVDSVGPIYELSEILGRVERIRIMHQQGHKDLFDEIRWTKEESERTKTGVDLRTVDVKASETLALRLAEDPEVIKLMKDFGGGAGFDKMTVDTIKSASALGCLFVPRGKDFWEIGRVIQRIWLKANQLGIAFQPVTACTFLFNRLLSFKGEDFNDNEVEKLTEALCDFQKIFGFNIVKSVPAFLFKLSIAPDPSVKSLRLPLDCVFKKI